MKNNCYEGDHQKIIDVISNMESFHFWKIWIVANEKEIDTYLLNIEWSMVRLDNRIQRWHQIWSWCW